MSVHEHVRHGAGKHWKDRQRFKMKQRAKGGLRIRTVPGQERKVQSRIVPAASPQEKTKIRREDNLDFPIPAALKGRVDTIRLKSNYERTMDADVSDERFVSSVLVIGFRGGYQQGIKGLLLPKPQERDCTKRAWTHVAIECLPDAVLDTAAGPRDWMRDPGYEERDMRITWYRRGAGSHRRNGKDGEVVKSFCDELQVLQWIVENDLEGFYGIPHLRGILPLRDEDRERHNAISAQAHTAFGAALSAVPTIPEHEFHRARAWQRIAFLMSEGDPAAANEEAVFERYAETKIGARAKKSVENGMKTGQRFFVHVERALVVAVYAWPGCREALLMDLVSNEGRVEPLEVNGKGLAFYEDAVLGNGFEEIDRVKYHDILVASRAGRFAKIDN